MGSQLSIMSTALLWLVFIICSADSSYLPPYYEGTPTAVSVVTLDSTDFRGQDVYRIEFSLQVENSTFPDRGFVHRSWEDFKDFDRLLKTHLLHFGLHLPETQSVESLDSYLNSMMSHSAVVSSNVFSDFLGINWSGRDLKFLQSLPEFFKIVIPPLYRAPDFPPEPPVFDSEEDTLLAEETPFEVYVYLKAFRSQTNLAGYLEFFNSYLNTNPSFTGAKDNSDVTPPGGLSSPGLLQSHLRPLPARRLFERSHLQDLLPRQEQVQLPGREQDQRVGHPAPRRQKSKEDSRHRHRAGFLRLRPLRDLPRGGGDRCGPVRSLHQDGEDLADTQKCHQHSVLPGYRRGFVLAGVGDI